MVETNNQRKVPGYAGVWSEGIDNASPENQKSWLWRRQ